VIAWLIEGAVRLAVERNFAAFLDEAYRTLMADRFTDASLWATEMTPRRTGRVG
jgi:hypothetical protein